MTETRVQRLGRIAVSLSCSVDGTPGRKLGKPSHVRCVVFAPPVEFKLPTADVTRPARKRCDRLRGVLAGVLRRPSVNGVAYIRSAAIAYPNLSYCCRRRCYCRCPTSLFQFPSPYFHPLDSLSKKLCPLQLINIS